MKIEIARKYLTIDVDTGSDEVRENIISNSGYSYLDEFILAYSTTDSNIVFIDKDYLVESMTKAKLGLELYDDEWGNFSEDSIPYIGRELLATMGEPNGTFFYSLMDEAYSILRDKFDNQESWRLPTINELRAMYDMNTGERLKGFEPWHYWSSTTYTGGHTFAHIMYFYNGYASTSFKPNGWSVRCVRTVSGDSLELAPSSEPMNWEDATEYAKNLKNVKQEDIITIKLDGLVYKEVKTTKEYKVILDVLVDTTELVPILVEAKDEDEAKQLAIKKYEANPLDFEPGLSDGREAYVNLNSINEWKVEEVK